jgi:predicted dehydrogenase
MSDQTTDRPLSIKEVQRKLKLSRYSKARDLINSGQLGEVTSVEGHDTVLESAVDRYINKERKRG